MRYACRLGRVLCLGALVTALSVPRALRADIDENGWIVDWLVFGPLVQNLGAAPGDGAIRRDFLTDGIELFESTIRPSEGDEVVPDFAPGGVAASEGFHAILNGENATWRAFNTIDPAGDGTVVNASPELADYNLYYAAGGAVENAMVYAVTYLRNSGPTALDARVELDSDDSVQVKLDDCEVFARSIARGVGAVNTFADSVALSISPGSHRLMVKVFNGGGGFAHRLRIIDNGSGAPAALDLSLEPTDLGVPEIVPVGLGLSHAVAPDRIIGLEKASTATITAVKTFDDLPDAQEVTVTENLIPGTELVAGTSVPAPTSQTATSLTWKIKVGDLVATGITFDFKFTRPDSGCLAGEVSTGNTSCALKITGAACAVAVIGNALFLGDMVGGGDGTGNKSPDQCGIRLDTGIPLLCTDLAVDNRHTDDSADLDALNPQPAEDNPYVDSVFFMSAETMEINSGGAEFTFEPGDLNLQGGLASSWNHILSNSTHDIDKGVGQIVCGGKGPFATGVGIHGSAGITFNLAEIRKKHGAENVVSLKSLVGIDGCAGHIRTYIIYSDDTSIVEEAWVHEFTAGQAEEYSALIPDDAKYVTFATGTAGDGDGCDHGVWAETRIFPELPEARITTNVASGVEPLTVDFSGSSSIPPTGKTITAYDWDFGDGATGTGVNISHTYAARGEYTAKLTVQTNNFLSDDESTQISVSFPCGNVAPYVSADVGAPALAGCARKDGTCIEVFGGGKDIAARSDQFQLVSKQKSGNVSLDAQLTELVFDGKTVGRAGLMFRDSTAPGSAFGFIHVNVQLGALKTVFLSRAGLDQTVATKTSALNLAAPNIYLRIERSGAELIGSASSDGASYTEVGRVTLAAPIDTMLAGMAVTSRDSASSGKGAEAMFCNIKYSDESSATEICSGGIDEDSDGDIDCADSDCAGDPACPVGSGMHRGDADDNGVLQLTDAIRILGFLFLGGAEPTCLDAADADDNGVLQLTDAIRILGFLFLGGPPPASPGPPPEACGVDSGAELGCASYTKC